MREVRVVGKKIPVKCIVTMYVGHYYYYTNSNSNLISEVTSGTEIMTVKLLTKYLLYYLPLRILTKLEQKPDNFTEPVS